MASRLKLFVSSAMVAVTFSTLQMVQVQGTDGVSKPGGELSNPLVRQLEKRADALEALLELGKQEVGNVLLKLSIDLGLFKRPIEEEQLENGKLKIPAQLFLVDANSHFPTAHPPVTLTVTVDCKSDFPIYTLPNKPSSFDSYAQFQDWLKGAYFSNQVRIGYDFNVDVGTSAPLLAQHLFYYNSVYRFIGTCEVDNPVIRPDECIPQVNYISTRGNTNKTKVTLDGILYLNEQPYPIDPHQQTFDHPIVDQNPFKKDKTKKFYSRKWLGNSETTARITYKEFPSDQIQNWPGAPVGSYRVLKKVPDDLEEINHLGCWDGASGEEIHLSDDQVFLIDCKNIKVDPESIESIVKDEAGNLHIVSYKYSDLGIIKRDARYKEEAEQQAQQYEELGKKLELDKYKERLTTAEGIIGTHSTRLTTVEGTVGTHSERLTAAEKTIGTPTAPVVVPAPAIRGRGRGRGLAVPVPAAVPLPRSLTQRLEDTEKRLTATEETIGTPAVPVLAVALGGTGEQGALAPRSLTQRLEKAETTLATHSTEIGTDVPWGPAGSIKQRLRQAEITLATHSTDLQNHTTKLGQVETEIGTDVPWGPAGSIKQRLKQAESNLTNLNNRYTGHCHPLVGSTVGYTNGPHQ